MRRIEVIVLDADAIPLTRAVASLDEESDRLLLDELSLPGALLDYYFGRGERTVMLQDPDAVKVGTVETNWSPTGRRWEVWLEASPIPDPPEALTETPSVGRGFG